MLPKIKKALEFEVKVLPPSKVEAPMFAKIKVPVGVKARASTTSTDIKALLPPRSRSFCRPHHQG